MRRKDESVYKPMNDSKAMTWRLKVETPTCDSAHDPMFLVTG